MSTETGNVSSETVDDVLGSLESLKKSMISAASAMVEGGDVTENMFTSETLQKSMNSEYLEGITLYMGTEMNHTREALSKSMLAQADLTQGMISMFKSMTSELVALREQVAVFGNAPRAQFKSVTPGAAVLEKSMSGSEPVEQPKFPQLEKMSKSMVSAKLSNLFEAGKVPIGLLTRFDAQGPSCLTDDVKTLIEAA